MNDYLPYHAQHIMETADVIEYVIQIWKTQFRLLSFRLGEFSSVVFALSGRPPARKEPKPARERFGRDAAKWTERRCVKGPF
jgi:hypothetical protein